MADKDSNTVEASLKPEKDFSEQTKQLLAKTQEMIKQGGKSKLREAIDLLLALEKQARLGGDADSTAKVVTEIIRYCGQTGSWADLNEQVGLIAKKRTQIKSVIAKMVQEAMTFLDKTPNKQTKVDLIDTLRRVSEGKIYVEVERARLVQMLSKIKEEEGNIKEAAELLQEVQIETVGSMEAREKIDFILEQMRLVLDKNDYVRALIVSKKITTRSLADKEHQDLKIRYYKLMIRYFTHEKNYLEICKCYHAIFETPQVLENVNAWASAMENMILFVVLSPFDNHQHDLMNRIFVEKKLEEKPLAVYRELLKLFISNEVILWPEFEQKFGPVLKNHKVFVDDKTRYDDLHNRVVEHNIRIISKYFSKITMKRLAQLLFLSEANTESFVSKMVSSKTIRAKIDRIDGIVVFKQPQETVEALNDWSSDIVQLLQLVEKSVHLINGQYMQAASVKPNKA